jgi:ribosome-associated protein
MTAGSQRQMEALSEDVVGILKRTGVSLYHREGNTSSGWLLLDFGDLVIHVFAPEQRAFYRLEELWSTGKELIRIQ